jgi:hypothetical protein
VSANENDGTFGLNRRQMLMSITACLATAATPMAVSASRPITDGAGFPNLKNAIGKVRRKTLRRDLTTIVTGMETAAEANDRAALTGGFQRMAWILVVLRNTLAPSVRRALLRGLLADATACDVQLANVAAAKREIRRCTTRLA